MSKQFSEYIKTNSSLNDMNSEDENKSEELLSGHLEILLKIVFLSIKELMKIMEMKISKLMKIFIIIQKML